MISEKIQTMHGIHQERLENPELDEYLLSRFAIYERCYWQPLLIAAYDTTPPPILFPVEKNNSNFSLLKFFFVSSSSDTHLRRALTQRGNLLISFALLPTKMQKWVCQRIDEEATRPRYSSCKKPGILEARLSELFGPYERLNSFLLKVTNKELDREILEFMWAGPITVGNCKDFYPFDSMKKTRALKERIRRLAKALVRSGIHSVRWGGSGRDGIIENKRLWDFNIYWIEGVHDEEDIQDHVILPYKRHAEQIGRPSDKVSPSKKKKIKPEVKTQTLAHLDPIKFERNIRIIDGLKKRLASASDPKVIEELESSIATLEKDSGV